MRRGKGHPSYQVGERSSIATVERQIRDLLLPDHLGQGPCGRIHLSGVGLHIHGNVGRSDLQGDVEGQTLIGKQGDAELLIPLEARGFDVELILRRHHGRKYVESRPDRVAAVATSPVVVWVRTTVAAGTTAPAGSTTVPLMLPRPWA